MTTKPRKPWRVILTQNGTQTADVPLTSEAKTYAHVRDALRSGDDTAKIMKWEDGRWIHFDTMTADDIPAQRS